MRKLDPDLIPVRPDLSFEAELWSAGMNWVGGVDEAGRGALAGPVAAAVAVLPADLLIADRLVGVRDSKQMTPKEREYWRDCLMEVAVGCAVGFAESREIDEFGIAPAVRLAVSRAIEQLSMAPQHLLVDYIELPNIDIPQTPIIKGDARSLTIAAASILAKTARDAKMRKLDTCYPGYGFVRNKGYGTKEHQAALEKSGPSPIHRLSFHFHHPLVDRIK